MNNIIPLIYYLLVVSCIGLINGQILLEEEQYQVNARYIPVTSGDNQLVFSIKTNLEGLKSYTVKFNISNSEGVKKHGYGKITQDETLWEYVFENDIVEPGITMSLQYFIEVDDEKYKTYIFTANVLSNGHVSLRETAEPTEALETADQWTGSETTADKDENHDTDTEQITDHMVETSISLVTTEDASTSTTTLAHWETATTPKPTTTTATHESSTASTTQKLTTATTTLEPSTASLSPGTEVTTKTASSTPITSTQPPEETDKAYERCLKTGSLNKCRHLHSSYKHGLKAYKACLKNIQSLNKCRHLHPSYVSESTTKSVIDEKGGKKHNKYDNDNDGDGSENNSSKSGTKDVDVTVIIVATVVPIVVMGGIIIIVYLVTKHRKRNDMPGDFQAPAVHNHNYQTSMTHSGGSVNTMPANCPRRDFQRPSDDYHYTYGDLYEEIPADDKFSKPSMAADSGSETYEKPKFSEQSSQDSVYIDPELGLPAQPPAHTDAMNYERPLPSPNTSSRVYSTLQHNVYDA